MATWPLSLPNQNYSISVGNTCESVEMDSGRIRQHQSVSDGVFFVNVNWTFTLSEYQTFLTFVNDTLKHGQDWFDIDLLTGDTVKTHEARFKNGDYRVSSKSDNVFNVSAVLDILDIDCYDNSDETMYFWYDLGELSASINDALLSLES